MKTVQSDKLKELSAEFLEKGDESGFWQEVQRIAASGNYPIVEEINNPNEPPSDHIRSKPGWNSRTPPQPHIADKGYDPRYQEYGGGHEMLSWRGGMAEGLKHIFQSIDLD